MIASDCFASCSNDAMNELEQSLHANILLAL